MQSKGGRTLTRCRRAFLLDLCSIPYLRQHVQNTAGKGVRRGGEGPRGEGARGWKTKVRWALCDAIDMGKLEDESGSIPGVDEETTARLKRLANFSKNLPAAGGADDMDVAQ